MSTKQTLVLSLAAGLTGGIFSRYLTPEMVHAQTQTPAPKEISAQSFALLDANGNRVGALTFSPTGRLAIALTYQGIHTGDAVSRILVVWWKHEAICAACRLNKSVSLLT